MLALGAADAEVIAVGDEYALFDLRSGLVADGLRLLRIRKGDRGIEQRALPPSDNRAVPVGVVAAIRYEPDGPPTAPISRANAMNAVGTECICGVSRPTDAFHAAVSVTATSEAMSGCHAGAR